MSTQQGATASKTNGKFPPISLGDLNRLKGVILDSESETAHASTAARRYTEIRRQLTDRYGEEHIQEAINRFKREVEQTDYSQFEEDVTIDKMLEFDREEDPANLIGNRWICKGYQA